MTELKRDWELLFDKVLNPCDWRRARKQSKQRGDQNLKFCRIKTFLENISLHLKKIFDEMRQ